MAISTHTAFSQKRLKAFLENLPELTASQIEDLLSAAGVIRRTPASLAEIEARTERDEKCPHCGCSRRQQWYRVLC